MLKTLLTIFVTLLCGDIYSAEWVRFFVARPSDSPGVPFGLLSTQGSQKSGLSAHGWYRYVEGRGPVTLHGKSEADKMFRPKVTYQVAVEGRTKWKEIRADIEQPDSESITFDPEHPGVGIVINMEPFRASIGVYRYGRVVLENGDATFFEIDDLLPTMDESGSGEGDFKIEVIQSEKEKRREGFTDAWLAEPATLAAVTSVGGRIIGDFVYSNRTREAITLSGWRTVDGDFWPKSKLQVGTSDGNWQAIGESENNGIPTTLEIPGGKAERIRVFLSEYRAVIDKHRFGKTVFSDGSGGIFTLQSLKGENDPPEAPEQ